MDVKNMLPIGALLRNGTYQVERQLSSGGFGNTYVVKNLNFDTTFAMKEFFMRGINNRIGTSVSVSQEDNAEVFESQRKKFKKEAQRIYRLNCQGITKIYDLFEDNGTTYYVMDYIDGQSLADRLSTTGSLSEAEALSVIKEVLRTLAVVHQQGFTHMDIKPGNIMQDKQGQVYLIDFGASKQLSKEEQRTLSTSTAMPYTEGYAPLEQMNKNMDNVGPWTDLYAVGATLYRLLTNFLPPLGDEITTDGRDAFRFPNPVSSSTQELIFWMMEQSRKKRPQSAEEVLQRIAEIQGLDEVKVDDEIPESDGEETVIESNDTVVNSHNKKQNPSEIRIPGLVYSEKKPRKSSKKWLWAIGIVFFAVIAVFVIKQVGEHAVAQNMLGNMYNLWGDYAEAVKWYRKGAEQGNSSAQNSLGYMYQYGYGVTKDYAEALKWYRKGAEQGNANAQNNLGTMYINGYGVEKNYEEALKWYRKTAEQNNPLGQNQLGWLYYNGYGVAKDYTKALKWFRKAADQGNATAQNSLGNMYYNGYGVTKDYAEAVKWYRKAAEQGYAAAQNNLGVMYQKGYGVEKNYEEAVEWYRKSAEQGNADAQNNLGYMFKNGYGVPKDIEEAKKWYFMAAEQGHENAKKALEQM